MKKLIGFIIILALILITPFSVLSEGANDLSQSETQSLAEQTTVPANDNAIELMAANTSIVNEAVYTIRNASSGKYVNVHNGIDATGTNVYQWTADGSAEQKFKLVYSSSEDAYKFYCMCSSNGTYRVLDIKRDNAAVASGQNVQICGPVDPTAQNWTIVSLGNGQYKICVKANTSLALTSYGTSNGTSTGTTATSAGNVFISTYTGSSNQIWYIEQDSASAATPHGWLDSVTSTKISGWAWRSDIPNTSIFVHLYLTNTTTNQVYVRNAGLANIYRADLEGAGIGNGCHGFSYAINWQDYPTGVYSVKAYAIGANENNPELMGSPKSYTSNSLIGYKGYAVYRDLSLAADIIANDWHAGLMDMPYATDFLPVIHSPGMGKNVEWIEWDNFIGDLDYYGVYRPKATMTDSERINVISLARELRALEVGYILTHQMQATLLPDATKIQPIDVLSLRCDGLIEYCYEYYGFRIYGDNDYWDISLPSASNLAHHSHFDITPQKQAQNYMTLVTTSVPN